MFFSRKTTGVMLFLWLTGGAILGAIPGMKVLPGHVPEVVRHLRSEGELPGTNRIALAIGVNLSDPAGLKEFVAQLCDPASPNFHQYLTSSEFTARYGPTPAEYAAVEAFAQTNGLMITKEHGSRLLLDVTGTVGAVEKAFHVTLRKYHHPTEVRDFYAPDTEPQVPVDLPIADISGLNNFSRPHPNFHPQPKISQPRQGSAPQGQYIGNDFRAAYVPGTALNGAGQTVGLVQFDGFYSNDIVAYENLTGITNYIPVHTVLVDGFSGTPSSSDGNTEVSLDIEMVMSMAPGVSSITAFEGNPNDFIPDDVLNIMADSNMVKNLSSSWGWSGGPSTTTDNIFLKMATQGQTYFSAAGDSDAFPPGYVDNSSNTTQPASDPYITQVGGTTLTTSSAGGAYESETVWNWGYDSAAGEYVGSCGGVSSYYTIPTWQLGINSFADNGGSTSYRNIPDVALTADNVYVLYGNGTNGSVGGTSCAAPLWAGFLALVNQQAAANEKSSVGFINPAIYELASETRYNAVFNDVTSGNNTSSSSPNVFYAVPGYDLCTGLGSPGGTNLINALVNPDPLIVVSNYGFNATNLSGGGFNVSTQAFYLTNISAAPLTWSLVNTSAWLSATSTGGTLVAGASQSVAVSLGSGVATLNPGTYTTTLWFSNVTSSVGHARTFSVSVSEPLTVLPTNFFDFTGPPGGPFTPANQTLVLTNPSSRSLNWTLGNTSAWFNLSAIAGTLAAGAQTSVTVTPAAGLTNLANGTYPVTMLLTDQTTRLVQPVNGLVLVSSSLVLNGSFETGDFTDWTLNGDPYPDDFVTNSSIGITPEAGSYEAIFGEVGTLAYLSQTLPTVAGQEYLLSLWLDNPSASSTRHPIEFTVSWNGSLVYNQTSLGVFSWNNLQFLVAATGPSTVLQFGGRDDRSFLALDNVSVTPVYPPSFTLQPTNESVLSGGSAIFSPNVTGSSPLVYQWLENGTNLANTAVISGANAGQLMFSEATTANDGNYSLVATNLYGASTSSVVSLTVYLPPRINLAVTNTAAKFAFSFTGPPGYEYIMFTTTNLAGGIWSPVYTNTFGTNGVGQFTDVQATNFLHRFYQLEVLP